MVALVVLACGEDAKDPAPGGGAAGGAGQAASAGGGSGGTSGTGGGSGSGAGGKTGGSGGTMAGSGGKAGGGTGGEQRACAISFALAKILEISSPDACDAAAAAMKHSTMPPNSRP